METTKRKKCCKKFFLFAPLFVAGLFALSAVVMLLWNWIIPSVIGWGVLSYWQAMGLLALCKILFGCGTPCRGRKHAHGMHKGHFQSHLMQMSDEEKASFKQKWSQRCCK